MRLFHSRVRLFIRLALLLGGCSLLLVLSPAGARFLGIAFLSTLALVRGMRPPRHTPLNRKLVMLRNLQRLHRINLAQHEGAPKAPYSPRQLRLIIPTLSRVEGQLRDKWEPGRWRLKHLVDRFETWSRQPEKLTTTPPELDTPKAIPTTPEDHARPFDPYRKKTAPKTPKPRGSAPQNFQLFSEVVLQEQASECLARPLCIELTVDDESFLDLPITYPAILASISRLRTLLASTGVVLPSVTLAVNSSRFGEDAGVLLRDVEQRVFQLTRRRSTPLPKGLAHGNKRLEGLAARPLRGDSPWPCHQLNARTQILIQLCRLVGPQLSELLSRQSLLQDIEHPAYPSRHYLERAKRYLQEGCTVPRGRFLELSLRLSTSSPDVKLSPDQKDLPSWVAVNGPSLPLFSREDCVFLTLAQLGSPRLKLWKRVQEKLSPELQKKMEERISELGESNAPNLGPEGEFERFSPFLSVQLFERFLEVKCQSSEWEETFGPAQFVLSTGYAVIERLLDTEKPSRAAEFHPKLAQGLCQSLAEKDSRWLALTLLMSHLHEGSTTDKVRKLARRFPGRLARLLENFEPSPLPRFRSPLEKLAIFCRSLGEVGQELEAQLQAYFPNFPPVDYQPQEAHQIQLEMLRRSRSWTLQGQGLPSSEN